MLFVLALLLQQPSQLLGPVEKQELPGMGTRVASTFLTSALHSGSVCLCLATLRQHCAKEGPNLHPCTGLGKDGGRKGTGRMGRVGGRSGFLVFRGGWVPRGLRVGGGVVSKKASGVSMGSAAGVYVGGAGVWVCAWGLLEYTNTPTPTASTHTPRPSIIGIIMLLLLLGGPFMA